MSGSSTQALSVSSLSLLLDKLVQIFDDLEIPEKLSPISESALNETLQKMYSRETIDYPYLEALGIDDPEELMDQINAFLKTQTLFQDIKLEKRNLLAVSGTAISIILGGWIVKYPTNEFLKPLLEAEADKHQFAQDLYQKWIASTEAKVLSFDPRTIFGVPKLKFDNGIYQIEYVGRSLDILILEKMLRDIDPNIDKKIKKFSEKMSLRQLLPSQMFLLFKKVLEYNFPPVVNLDIHRSEILACVIAYQSPLLEKIHYEALNSFLDFGYNQGFVYLDKIIDNSTIGKDQKLYLIDYGVSQVFDNSPPPYSMEQYNEIRKNQIDDQLSSHIKPAS